MVKKVGKYEIGKTLGEGCMARDPALERTLNFGHASASERQVVAVGGDLSS